MLRSTLIPIVLLSTLLLAGCPTASTPTAGFTAGSGETFGVATSADGGTFDIKSASQGRIRVVSNGPAGEVVFEIDTDGRLVAAEGPSGTNFELTYNDDGSVFVSGTVVFRGETEPFAGTIPAGALTAAATTKGLTAQGSDPFTVCVAINAFCGAFDALLDEIIGIVALELLGVDVYPTGFPLIDDPVREQALERVPILLQVQGFCTLWPLLNIEACQ